jgi:hypothetical protein
MIMLEEGQPGARLYSIVLKKARESEERWDRSASWGQSSKLKGPTS